MIYLTNIYGIPIMCKDLGKFQNTMRCGVCQEVEFVASDIPGIFEGEIK